VGAREGLVELLDLFPTLLDVLGVPPDVVPPAQLQGASLAPFLLEGAAPAPPRAAAFTQISRGDPPHERCVPPDAAGIEAHALDSDPPAVAPRGLGGAPQPDCRMGLSLRVPGWRYTAWTAFNYSTPDGPGAGPIWERLLGEELYDHTAADAGADAGAGDAGEDFDATESVSVAGDPAYAAVRARLAAQLRAAWASFAAGGVV